MTGPVIRGRAGRTPLPSAADPRGGSGKRLAVGNTERHLGQHVVLSLPRDSGCDAIASLPRSAEDEGEEGEDQDYDDHEATAIGPAAIDAALPLIPEFPFGAHFVLCRF